MDDDKRLETVTFEVTIDHYVEAADPSPDSQSVEIALQSLGNNFHIESIDAVQL